MSHPQQETGQAHEQFVSVTVFATSGVFPEDGFERVPAHQKLKVILEQAARALKIVGSTSEWVAMSDGRELNPDLSLTDNGLRDVAKIDWGRREGGGG